MRHWHPLMVVMLLAPAVHGEEWPQWLGPRRDGSSAEKVTPWKEAPKAAWRVPVGEGHSSPVVAGGKVFLHTRAKDADAEQVAAYNAISGKPVWTKSYPRAKFQSVFGLGPRGTPAVDDGKVYTLGVTGVLACWNADDGKQVWMVDTAREFQPPALTFGVSGSPLIEGDKVLVNVGAKGASIVAFDKKTGKVAWKAGDDPASYSSPVVFGEGAKRQVVFLTQQGLVSLNPSDGSVFWKVPLVDKLNESSTTPIKVGDLLFASSVTFGAIGVELKKDKPSANQAWKNPRLTCYFSTPVPVGKDHLYLVTGTFIPPPGSTLRCIDIKTGKETWNKPKVAKYHAALLRTGDDKLLMLDDNGFLTLLDPSPQEYKELCRAKVCKPTWAHPALSNGRLYLRDNAELICLSLADQGK